MDWLLTNVTKEEHCKKQQMLFIAFGVLMNLTLFLTHHCPNRQKHEILLLPTTFLPFIALTDKRTENSSVIRPGFFGLKQECVPVP